MKCDELQQVENPIEWGLYYDKNEVDAAIAELKDKNRKLQRALYKACANWARSERYTEATWHGDEHREERWAEVERKCLKKAEEYK